MSSAEPQFKSNKALNIYSPTLTFVHDNWKNQEYNYLDLCQQSMSLLFNRLSRFVKAFFLRWGLKSSKSSFTHKSGGWSWLLAGGLSSCFHGSLHTVSLCGWVWGWMDHHPHSMVGVFPGEHLERERVFFSLILGSYILFLLSHFTHWGSHRVHPGARGGEIDSVPSWRVENSRRMIRTGNSVVATLVKVILPLCFCSDS